MALAPRLEHALVDAAAVVADHDTELPRRVLDLDLDGGCGKLRLR